MSTEAAAAAPTASPAFEWQEHIGLLIGVAASTLICLKLLAVAGWDSTTAFGILAASGTANVLTGTLLAVLPTLYGAFVFVVVPRIEMHLRRRTSVERAAARIFEVWPVILLVFIVPVGLLLVIFGTVLLSLLLSVIEHVRARRSHRGKKTSTTENEAPSRFEAMSAGLGALMILAFGSLATPWVPPEVMVTSDGEETAYVLSRDEDMPIVLLDNNRTLVWAEGDDLPGTYCQLDTDWWSEPVMRLFENDKYPPCPLS